MVTDAKRAGAKVLLVGMRIPPNYGGAYTREFDAMFTAAREGAQNPPRAVPLRGLRRATMPCSSPIAYHPVVAAQTPRSRQRVDRIEAAAGKAASAEMSLRLNRERERRRGVSRHRRLSGPRRRAQPRGVRARSPARREERIRCSTTRSAHASARYARPGVGSPPSGRCGDRCAQHRDDARDRCFCRQAARVAPLVYCWRGGQRSRALTHMLNEVGWRAAQLDGGYRAYRRHVVAELLAAAALPLRRDLRPHGLRQESAPLRARTDGAQMLDLEGIARHRGSVLGDFPDESEDAEDLGLQGGAGVGAPRAAGAERVDAVGEEAEAELAAGGQAQAVAVGAEGVGEGGDEADRARGRRRAGRRAAGPVRGTRRLDRRQRAEAGLQALRATSSQVGTRAGCRWRLVAVGIISMKRTASGRSRVSAASRSASSRLCRRPAARR